MKLMAIFSALAVVASMIVTAIPASQTGSEGQVSTGLCAKPQKVKIVDKDNAKFINEDCKDKLCLVLRYKGDLKQQSYIEPTSSEECKDIRCNKGDGKYGSGLCRVDKSTTVVLKCVNGATMSVTTSDDGKDITWQALEKSKDGHQASLSIYSQIASHTSGDCPQPTTSGKVTLDTNTEQATLYCEADPQIACM